MSSSASSSFLPTAIHVTVGARLTLPASTAEETVRGSGRQVRLLRAGTLEALAQLVARELRAHALVHCGETRQTRAARPTKSAGATATKATATIALQVLAALDAGDLAAAARAHAEGFGLPVELPPQFGGAFGNAEDIPAPPATRARLAADRQAALLADLEASAAEDGAARGDDADAEDGEDALLAA
jgi:hypothetical protein